MTIAAAATVLLAVPGVAIAPACETNAAYAGSIASPVDESIDWGGLGVFGLLGLLGLLGLRRRDR